MLPQIGKKYLISTNEWFVAPDGEYYKAVFGTVNGIVDAEEMLGIKPNRHSTNWYVSIGNMLIGGCQIHYCIRTNKVSLTPPKRLLTFELNSAETKETDTRIYVADEKKKKKTKPRRKNGRKK